MENLGLCFKIRSTAISIVSFNGMFVKRLSTSKEMMAIEVFKLISAHSGKFSSWIFLF